MLNGQLNRPDGILADDQLFLQKKLITVNKTTDGTGHLYYNKIDLQ